MLTRTEANGLTSLIAMAQMTGQLQTERASELIDIVVREATAPVDPNLAEIARLQKRVHEIEHPDRLTASEAVYGLLAWLTCRERALTVSAKHEAGQVVKLAEAFIAANNLGSVRPDYAKHLTHPKEPA